MRLLGHDFEKGRCRDCGQHLSDLFLILGLGTMAVVMLAISIALVAVWVRR